MRIEREDYKGWKKRKGRKEIRASDEKKKTGMLRELGKKGKEMDQIWRKPGY